MSNRRREFRREIAAGFEPCLAAFTAALTQAGYAEKTRRDKERLVAYFLEWAEGAGLTVQDIDGAAIEEFLRRPSRCRYGHRAALMLFHEHLQHMGVAAAPDLAMSSAEQLLQRYVDHLRDDRGLSTRSIEIYSPFVREFVADRRLPEQVAALDALAVRDYFLSRSRSRPVAFVRLLAAALRSFLRFCLVQGAVTADLSTAVLPVRRWQFATLPPFLTAAEVERVIAAATPETGRGCRDFAILLLLARLGLRAGEIVRLELADIRWEAGELVVHGKGRHRDRLLLLADVGEALASYLRTARGSSRSRRVFLRCIAPRTGLQHPAVVSKIAREALQRAELLPRGRAGAHIFRHSLATRMMGRGASLTEISRVLRHRWIGTTRAYARVDVQALRAVALPWPKEEVQP